MASVPIESIITVSISSMIEIVLEAMVGFLIVRLRIIPKKQALITSKMVGFILANFLFPAFFIATVSVSLNWEILQKSWTIIFFSPIYTVVGFLVGVLTWFSTYPLVYLIRYFFYFLQKHFLLYKINRIKSFKIINKENNNNNNNKDDDNENNNKDKDKDKDENKGKDKDKDKDKKQNLKILQPIPILIKNFQTPASTSSPISNFKTTTTTTTTTSNSPSPEIIIKNNNNNNDKLKKIQTKLQQLKNNKNNYLMKRLKLRNYVAATFTQMFLNAGVVLLFTASICSNKSIFTHNDDPKSLSIAYNGIFFIPGPIILFSFGIYYYSAFAYKDSDWIKQKQKEKEIKDNNKDKGKEDKEDKGDKKKKEDNKNKTKKMEIIEKILKVLKIIFIDICFKFMLFVLKITFTPINIGVAIGLTIGLVPFLRENIIDDKANPFIKSVFTAVKLFANATFGVLMLVLGINLGITLTPDKNPHKISSKKNQNKQYIKKDNDNNDNNNNDDDDKKKNIKKKKQQTLRSQDIIKNFYDIGKFDENLVKNNENKNNEEDENEKDDDNGDNDNDTVLKTSSINIIDMNFPKEFYLNTKKQNNQNSNDNNDNDNNNHEKYQNKNTREEENEEVVSKEIENKNNEIDDNNNNNNNNNEIDNNDNNDGNDNNNEKNDERNNENNDENNDENSDENSDENNEKGNKKKKNAIKKWLLNFFQRNILLFTQKFLIKFNNPLILYATIFTRLIISPIICGIIIISIYYIGKLLPPGLQIIPEDPIFLLIIFLHPCAPPATICSVISTLNDNIGLEQICEITLFSFLVSPITMTFYSVVFIQLSCTLTGKCGQ